MNTDDYWESPLFKDGYDLGEADTELRIYEEVKRAYETGKLDLWLEKMRPKTFSEWENYFADGGTL